MTTMSANERIAKLASLLHIMNSKPSEVELYERAIVLFEHLVWMACPWSSKRVRQAGRLAAVKLIEHVEAQLSEHLGHAPSLQELSQSQAYSYLFNQYRRRGGNVGFRHTPSARYFDRKVLENLEKGEIVAKVVDVSIRFRRMHPERRLKGSATNAIEYLACAKKGIKKSALHDRWKKHKASAIWFYSLELVDVTLRPPNVASKGFVRRLLRQGSETETLRKLLSIYCAAQQNLSQKAYVGYGTIDGFVPDVVQLPSVPLLTKVVSDLKWNDPLNHRE